MNRKLADKIDLSSNWLTEWDTGWTGEHPDEINVELVESPAENQNDSFIINNATKISNPAVSVYHFEGGWTFIYYALNI